MMRASASISLGLLLLAGSALAPAHAQQIGYGDMADGGEVAGGDAAPTGDAPGGLHVPPAGGHRTFLLPYVELAQVVTSRHIAENETFTYSRAAAGIEASRVGRNSGASVSLRYERRIAWGDKQGGDDGDALSGLVNGYVTVAPGVQLHAGGLAAREHVSRDGASILGARGNGDAVTQVYSMYAGPSVSTRAGDVAIKANYNFGYTRVEQPDAFSGAASSGAADLFDESKVHSAGVEASVQPGEVLPVGLGAGGTYYREDISNLDQRVEDMQARATVTVPVTTSVAVSGAVGYESVEVSARDAVRGADGFPVVGKGGNYVTDKSAPRVLAYDVDGLIWDAGVMWRPSRRTALTAHVGRRYGSISYNGTFSYAPSSRGSLNVAVYDNVAGFGGQVNRMLTSLPVGFEAVRNPFSGDIGGCVAALEAGSCLSGNLGSVRSNAFRARGVAASYAMQLGHLNAGIGGGYDRRKFIAAPGTVLASAAGLIDENYWLAAYLNARLNQAASIDANVYANWIESGGALAGDTRGWGATAAYNHAVTSHLSATAALGVEGLSEVEMPDDTWSASALLGMRYSF